MQGQWSSRTKIDANHPNATGAPAKSVTVTDPGGNQVKTTYDLSAGGRMIAMVDGRGKRTTFG